MAASRFDVAGDALKRLGIARDQRHGARLCCQMPGDFLADAAARSGHDRAAHDRQILDLGARSRAHSTNFYGTAMVERRPCRTSAQSSNFFDCLISASVRGGSTRPANSSSTTADFGFFGSGRGSDTTFATPTTAETPPL